uniref:Uncharacterized protein n=1 Tax=Anguilla anguilla TaxID=7936 RepID=A0A0E9XVT8_ANGAN
MLVKDKSWNAHCLSQLSLKMHHSKVSQDMV